MAVKLNKRLITVAEYHLMGEVGILKEKGLELIHGEILEMSPIGSKHAACVEKIKDLLVFALRGKAQVRTQNPIILDDFSAPEPDISVVRFRSDYYADAHPQAQDTLLLIEVALSSVAYDQEVKVPLYAAAGIPELWIVDLEKEVLEVFRNPGAAGYATQEVLGPGDVLSPSVWDIQVNLKEVLG